MATLALRRTEPDANVCRELTRLIEEQRVLLLGPVRQEILSGYYLDSRRKSAAAQPDYRKLAGQLKNGQVILCLGQELSHLLGTHFPSTAEIIEHFAAQEGFHGPLSELCEHKEIAPDSSRAELVSELRALFWIERKNPPAVWRTYCGGSWI